MTNRYPSPEELYALERGARRLRSVELARLAHATFAAVSRALRAPKGKVVKGLKHA